MHNSNHTEGITEIRTEKPLLRIGGEVSPMSKRPISTSFWACARPLTRHWGSGQVWDRICKEFGVPDAAFGRTDGIPSGIMSYDLKNGYDWKSLPLGDNHHKFGFFDPPYFSDNHKQFRMFKKEAQEIWRTCHRIAILHPMIYPTSWFPEAQREAMIAVTFGPLKMIRCLQVFAKIKPLHTISTLLYSGRKSWFVKHAAEYFRAHPCTTLIEPFDGSSVVGLSLLHAGMIERLILVDKDPRIVCLLYGLLHDSELADRYAAFKCTRKNVIQLLREEKSAFRYLVQLRCSNRGRFSGELRTAIDARWCRDMVVGNIRRVHAMRDRVTVIEGDGLELMRQHAGDRTVGCFADSPYIADITSKRHMAYHEHKLNQQKLFSILAGWSGPWLLTEDDSLMVRRLALCYRFASKQIPMTTADNKRKKELVLWRKRRFQSFPLPGSVVGIQHEKGETQ